MTFVQPSGLWLLGLIPVILVLHILRSSPRRVVVPAAFLWRGLRRDATASRRWRVPPPGWLLLLQILAVGAGALAVAQPRLVAPPPRHLILLLDASASMLATDAGPTRFDLAVNQARAMLAGLRPYDRVTLLRVGPRPVVVRDGTDPATALSALGDLRAGAGSAAMREALWLAGGVAGRVEGADSEVVVITDGAFAEPGDLTEIGVPIRFQIVGRGGENQAVTAVSVARGALASMPLSVFARVANYADRPVRLPVQLSLDGVVSERREVDVAARSRADLVFEAPESTGRVAVALGGGDALAADDAVEVAVDGGRIRSALVVSRLPGVMERALRAIPNLRVESVAPESYSGGTADLVVFDGVLPERLPGGHVLIVNPPPGREYLRVEGEARSVQVTAFDVRHPILRAVDLSAVRLAKVTVLTAPPWATLVAEAGSAPLILEGRESGRSVVIFAFDPAGSGIDRMLAFPLLVSNVTSFLGSGGVSPSLLPGQTAVLPVTPGTRGVELEGPDGLTRSVPARGSSVTLAGLESPGRYTVRERGGAPEVRGFSVNVADEAESDIRPRPRADVAAAPLQAQASTAPMDLWPGLLSLGFVILSVEWWRFGRGG